MNRAGGCIRSDVYHRGAGARWFDHRFRSEKKRKVLAWILTGVLLFCSAAQNYDLVFNQFDQQFRLNSWNSSEMGAVIKQFGLVYGETDTVWIVPFPYWVDTRLPGVWAGIPNRDFAMFPDQLADTVSVLRHEIVHREGQLYRTRLPMTRSRSIFSSSCIRKESLSLHHSPVPGHDFWIYFVPSQ